MGGHHGQYRREKGKAAMEVEKGPEGDTKDNAKGKKERQLWM